MSTELKNILGRFNNFTEKPVKFLNVQSDLKDDIKHLVKSIYDFTRDQENVKKKRKKGALPELIVEDFDEEQIWQQIELHNSESWDQLVWEVANCISVKNELEFPIKTSEESIVDEDVNPEEEDVSEPDMSDLERAEEEHLKSQTKNKYIKKKCKPSIVDDKFFKLSEMEQFLLKEEKKGDNTGKREPGSDEESIDLFEDLDDDDDEVEEGENVMYNDFFDGEENRDIEPGDDIDEDENLGILSKNDENNKTNKSDKRVRFAQESSDDNESEDESVNSDINANKISTDEKKSEFEMRQQRLKQHIERLEDKTLKEAPWQLKGEVDATKRPQNSLLEEVVDFDLTTRPAPIITEETTLTLEEIITQRVKDKAWDDVVKKEKPVDDPLTFRKKEILDHSKSKLSLAQVYEAEYLKQKQKLSGEVEEEKEPDSHKEIRDAMSQLFAKLDALSHYHYTPRAAQPEVKIVSNTPAISMEEVAPIATSDATMLAPEEVKKKQKGDMMSKEERTKTDRNRERRKKKKLQRQKGQVPKVTNNRNTKKGDEVNDNKSVKTSKAFFEQLNNDTKSLIKKNVNKNNVKTKG